MVMDFTQIAKKRKSVRQFKQQPVEEEKIERILECARLAPSALNLQCWHFIVIKERENVERAARAGGAHNDWLKDVPVLILACGDPKKSTEHNGIQYYIVDVAIAMQNLVMAATDLGLGTCWIANFDEEVAREALGIPENIKVVAMTPIGYPDDDEPSPRRKPLEKIVHREKW